RSRITRHPRKPSSRRSKSMLDIVLQDNLKEAIGQIDQVEHDQVPFATSLAINRLALKAQSGIQAGIAQRFTLRRPRFILNTIKIEKRDFSTKKNPAVFRVKVDDTRTKSGRRDLLAAFETGEPKESV